VSRFERIHVQGFRRLIDLDLELRPLNVLIGANGSGKTSLLDVFSLLAASASGGLSAKLSELGGMTSVLSLDKAQRLSIELSMTGTQPQVNPLIYSLAIAPSGVAYQITQERLSQDRGPVLSHHIDSQPGAIGYADQQGKLVSPTWDYKPLETALSQVPHLFTEPDAFRSRLASSAYYHELDVGPRAPVRLPQPLQPANLPGTNGEDLVSCLFSMREADRDRYEAVEDALRVAFPGFERLDFPPVAAGTLAMTWKDSNFSRPFYMHQLSEGMLRFLWLAALLQSPGLPAVTLLDEPEVSLHPELLSLLAELMREASAWTQLIVATHADRFVQSLKPNEVIVMDLEEDGTVRATWGDQLDLDEWLKDYTLDEVWSMGLMGGRAGRSPSSSKARPRQPFSLISGPS
jgi:predicted ATPase